MDITSELMKDFVGGVTLDALPKKYGITRLEIRKVLIGILGINQYLKIARSNGGKAVAKKLECPSYRIKYTTKMRLSVRNSLSNLMTDDKFRKAWVKKAKRGSKQGTKNLLNRLTDDNFYQQWLAKCKKGGLKVYAAKLGFHAAPPKFRRIWSLNGLRKTARKMNGPNGEKMYNALEVRTAAVLKKLGLEYVYEKILPAKNKNGFVSVDFVIKNMPGLFIEATCWGNVRQKALELNAKLGLLKNTNPSIDFVVVTTTKYSRAYQAVLESNINVFTPIEFEKYMARKLAG